MVISPVIQQPTAQDCQDHTGESKLIILPGSPHVLGGTLISLLMLVQGFRECGQLHRLLVLVQAGSLMEETIVQAGLGHCLVPITGTTKVEYLRRSLHWVTQQPRHYPLLLENCVQRDALLPMLEKSVALRFQQRPVYLLFRDLATSHNLLGTFARSLTFRSLGIQAIGNSHFTAQQISQRYTRPVIGVLYPAVDLDRFKPEEMQSQAPQSQASRSQMPSALQPIVRSGRRLMLTVSRISKPGIVNDKNLRIIPAVLAELQRRGEDYAAVIVGQDRSLNHERSQFLRHIAEDAGVADRFHILPPDLHITAYYHHADVLVSLAPREPFGRTIVEAVASGLPVVGSNTGGIREILSNFAPDWMVDPHDPIAAAEAILRVVTSPTTPHRLAEGQTWVRDHCAIHSTVQALMTIVGLAGGAPHD